MAAGISGFAQGAGTAAEGFGEYFGSDSGTGTTPKKEK
jgi:hypothetical protein